MAAVNKSPRKIIYYILSAVLILSCKERKHTRDEIESAMEHYDQLILKMDADSIALLYAQDGDLGDVAHGRDSIKKFLEKFNDYRVITQYSSSDSISITGDSSFQKGVYHQVTLSPKKDTLSVMGSYEANWIWIPGDGWKIRRMITKPVQ